MELMTFLGKIIFLNVVHVVLNSEECTKSCYAYFLQGEQGKPGMPGFPGTDGAPVS